MRIAVISDIHSSVQGLEAVMKEIDNREVDLTVCAGDIIGYGVNPNECCHIVKNRVDHYVRGNHEKALLTGDVERMREEAVDALKWTNGVLDAESREFLRSLGAESRFRVAGKEIAVFHGSVDSLTEYIYEWDMSKALVQKSGADVLILGHTHVPYACSFGRRLALNPGSVGQPRDGNHRASFAIIDTDAMEARIIRVPYDIDAAATAIRESGIPIWAADKLANRLYDGE